MVRRRKDVAYSKYLAGSLKPKQGGAIIANNTTNEELVARVNQDPFVVAKVVKPEILEISPARAAKELEFVLP